MSSQAALATTLRHLVSETRDSTEEQTIVYDMLKKDGSVDVVDGGTSYDTAPFLQSQSAITNHSTGYEPVDMTFKDGPRKATWDWNHATIPVGLSKMDQLENNGDKAKLKLLDHNIKSAMYLAMNTWEKQVVYGGTAFSNMVSLNGAPAAKNTGFFEDSTRALANNIVGGISRGTYENWRHQESDVAAAFGTGTVGLMTNLYVKCQHYSVGSKHLGPNLIIMSDASFALLKSATAAREFLTKDLDLGRMGIMWNGAYVFPSQYLPTEVGPVVGEPISAYFLRTDSLRAGFLKGGQFELGDFNVQSGYNIQAANLSIACALGAVSFRGQGALIDAET